MGKKKPRHNKMDAKKFDTPSEKPKKEKDWGFDEILRSKRRSY